MARGHETETWSHETRWSSPDPIIPGFGVIYTDRRREDVWEVLDIYYVHIQYCASIIDTEYIKYEVAE